MVRNELNKYVVPSLKLLGHVTIPNPARVRLLIYDLRQIRG